ncbi:MAG: phospho-N-acetylmuramoyl-pentapeptide-transferase [Lachnospiraceae bacterium]|nr:phospho-N-acetylmuramoyl-pentapeptide-transferase [Lachnospiraceae bacterium]
MTELKQTIVAMMLALVLSAIFCRILIPILHKFKFGQQIRALGPQEHLKKQGTPTMGGIAFIAATVLACLPFLRARHLPVLFALVGNAFVGGLDDYLKIKRHSSDGLSPKQKLLGQFAVAAILLVFLYWRDPSDWGSLRLPILAGYRINISYLFIPFFFFTMLGTENGANMTDGLDGLCSMVTIIIMGFFLAASFIYGEGLGVVGGAFIGALIGFLLFNAYPAKLFMGDTGSLAIGGFVAMYAILMQMPLYILIVAFIYVIELVSTIIQVQYFRHTGGKRFFRMAPIHHHYEKGGWSEVRIVTVFSVVTLVLACICLLPLL